MMTQSYGWNLYSDCSTREIDIIRRQNRRLIIGQSVVKRDSGTHHTDARPATLSLSQTFVK